MRDHVLLQAIARVNRPYDDTEERRKPAGFVLDFVGIFENLEKALAFDTADVSGVIEDLDLLRQRFDELMDEARDEYLGIGAGKVADKEAEALLEHFRDQARREAFDKFYRELEELYEILSPDERLRPHVEDFARLGAIYRLLRVSYEPHIAVEKSFLRKTAELVQARTTSGDILDPDEVYTLDEGVIEVLADPDTSETVKVFNLVKVLDDQVRKRSREASHRCRSAGTQVERYPRRVVVGAVARYGVPAGR